MSPVQKQFPRLVFLPETKDVPKIKHSCACGCVLCNKSYTVVCVDLTHSGRSPGRLARVIYVRALGLLIFVGSGKSANSLGISCFFTAFLTRHAGRRPALRPTGLPNSPFPGSWFGHSLRPALKRQQAHARLSHRDNQGFLPTRQEIRKICFF